MAFIREGEIRRVPAAIGTITVLLQTDGAGNEGIKGQFEVLDQNGLLIRAAQVPLVDHLTGAQVAQLRAFLDLLRARAVSEMLP